MKKESEIEEEKEVIVDEKYMDIRSPKCMLIASGVKKSVVSREWIEGYLKDKKIDEDEINRKSCCRRFRMGDTAYLSEVEIRFPILLKTVMGDYIKREVTANIIDGERVYYLPVKETMKEQKLIREIMMKGIYVLKRRTRMLDIQEFKTGICWQFQS